MNSENKLKTQFLFLCIILSIIGKFYELIVTKLYTTLEQQVTDRMGEVGQENRVAVYFRTDFQCLVVDSIVVRVVVLWNLQTL